jgi:hypothetical protein
MPENKTSRARDYAPVYECRGYSIPQFGTSIPWCWIWSKAADRVLGLRPSQLVQLSTLLAINPDISLWRRWFRAKDGTGVDVSAAGASLMADCYAAGEMPPPDATRIRKPGRPSKVAA